MESDTYQTSSIRKIVISDGDFFLSLFNTLKLTLKTS